MEKQEQKKINSKKKGGRGKAAGSQGVLMNPLSNDPISIRITGTLIYAFNYNQKTDEFRPIYQVSKQALEVLPKNKQLMLSFLITNIKYRKFNKTIEKVLFVMIVLVCFLALSIVAWFVFLFMHRVTLIENDKQVNRFDFPLLEYLICLIYQVGALIITLTSLIKLGQNYRTNFSSRMIKIIRETIIDSRYLDLYSYTVDYKNAPKKLTIIVSNKL